jgi:flagellar protein FliL
MSAAAAVVDATETPKKKGSKKLVLILAVVVLLLAVGGGVAYYMMQKKAAEAAAAAAAEEGDEGDEAAAKPAHKAAKKESHGAPTFLPIDPFVVNLADREQERFAQIGVTLQVDDAKAAEQLKLYMPAIRNGVLLILSHKTSTELLERAGKEKLAREIMREAVRPLGIEVDSDDAEGEGHATDEKPAKKKKKKASEHNPVEHVHFSSFIIQ